MKFGDTLYRRSVPKWAAYNFQYNELKNLIKQRTSNGAPSPMPIPGQSDHRWTILEDELYAILKEQYDNIGLFLRSKYGEIERRLAYLDKSVRSAKRSANLFTGRPSLQARKYQRLIQEAESIGEDIQALTRFAAIQKTAFRKILKKYQKWTNSIQLRARLDVEVFSDGQLDLNLTEPMQHLSAQLAVIKELESALLRPDTLQQGGRRPSSARLDSPVRQITKAAQSGPLHFDAAIASVPFGEAAGTATYWIHIDNLEEARVLLLRYMRDSTIRPAVSREDSADSSDSTFRKTDDQDLTHACFLDNGYRFAQDTSEHSPSKAAMCARWSKAKEAVITMSDMSPKSDTTSTLVMKRKELDNALDRDSAPPKDRSASSANVRTVKDFLSQHRDVKALAEVQSERSRFAGLTNSSEVGTFATLDMNIAFAPFDKERILEPDRSMQSQHSFPHAVLQVRWEFGRKPEVVRAFDTTHLAERVLDFSLENAAIHSQNNHLMKPSWTIMLQKDIRKVPVHARYSKKRDMAVGLHSAPSSTDGPIDSVFSTPLVHSTAGSETSPVASTHDTPVSQSETTLKPKKKKARIIAQSPPRQRYYSEYEDPDSEFYQQEAYTIYVDPNEEAPGMATLRKIGNAIATPLTWLNMSAAKSKNGRERTPLLTGTSEEDASSESDGDLIANSVPVYKGLQGRVRPAERYRMRLSRRQRRYERMLTQFYWGLVALSYIFLFMSAIMLTTGRKKEVIEVDVGATVGVIVSMVCVLASFALIYMRKEKLNSVEIISLVLADGMFVLLGAAVVIGIVQRATHAKRQT